MNSKMPIAAEDLLLERAKAGNSEAFCELVRLNSSSVYGISLKILKNREDAEDNLQNVFCKAYRKISDFHGESRVSTWLFRIAINEALMQLRRRSDREVRFSDVPDTDDKVPSIQDAEDLHSNPENRCIHSDLTEKAFRACSPTMANIFVLNKAEGWTIREIAKLFGTNPQTVKSRVFRTRIRLRQQMAALTSIRELAY